MGKIRTELEAKIASNRKHYGRLENTSKPKVENVRTDLDVLKENFKFVREDGGDRDTDNEEKGEKSWEDRLAIKYEKQLFKEFAVIELSKYKEGKVALRWRTKLEVLAQFGKTSCGNLSCSSSKKFEVQTFEVNFGYMENNVKKNELVKVKLCRRCEKKLLKVYPNAKSKDD